MLVGYDDEYDDAVDALGHLSVDENQEVSHWWRDYIYCAELVIFYLRLPRFVIMADLPAYIFSREATEQTIRRRKRMASGNSIFFLRRGPYTALIEKSLQEIPRA